jgi:hypothetical protein
LIILPFFAAVIATIIYTDNVIRSRKAASTSSSTNLDNDADSDDYYIGVTGTDNSSYTKDLTDESKNY